MKRWDSTPSPAGVHGAATSKVTSSSPAQERCRDLRRMEFALHPAVGGERRTLHSRSAELLSWYQDGPPPTRGAPPLLLVHGISAASSAYDMKPLYEHYRTSRRVYSLELPGFGFSARTDHRYGPRLMTDAIHELLEQIRKEYTYAPVDAVALSLSCEFLARAATENSAAFRSLAFISPTGLEKPRLREGRVGSTLEKRWLRDFVQRSRWRRPLYDLLTRPASIRFFLRRSFGSRNVDPGLIDYDIALAGQSGSEFAPLNFIAGNLFSGDSGRLYRGIKKPIWLVHGTRGSFNRYAGVQALADRHNWTFDVLPTGAMPHFEMLDEFVRRYDAWLRVICPAGLPQMELARTDAA